MSLGENIRNIRKARGLSIMNLRELTGLSKSTISDLENDKSSPTAETLQKIANALNINIEDFFKDNSESPSINDLTIKPSEDEFLIKESSSAYRTKIPKQFINSSSARSFVKSFAIFGSDGFDSDKLDDEEILKFANELLEHMNTVKYKYKK